MTALGCVVPRRPSIDRIGFIPAKAGIHWQFAFARGWFRCPETTKPGNDEARLSAGFWSNWIPAFAGMTHP